MHSGLCLGTRSDAGAGLRGKGVTVALEATAAGTAAHKEAPATVQALQSAAHRAFRGGEAISGRDQGCNLPVGDNLLMRLENAEDGNLQAGKSARAVPFSGRQDHA